MEELPKNFLLKLPHKKNIKYFNNTIFIRQNKRIRPKKGFDYFLRENQECIFFKNLFIISKAKFSEGVRVRKNFEE